MTSRRLSTTACLFFGLFASACAGKSGEAEAPPNAAETHSAHGHAVAVLEREEGSEMMVERIEDEDTHWVELPNFGECPYEDPVPPYEAKDDSHVPGLGPTRTRATNMDAGDETIHNEALLQRLDQATTEVLNCVGVSACYDERALEPGSIELIFEVAPSGKVRGVDVDLSDGLDHTGIRECARLSIWDTKFAAFDGADMIVDYKLDID